MKKLCALAASLIIGAASFGAQAGDRHRGHDRHDYRHEHRHDHHHREHRRGHDHHHHPAYGRVYYQAVPVYHSPVRYYSYEPVYRERVRYRDNGVHGSITVGF